MRQLLYGSLVLVVIAGLGVGWWSWQHQRSQRAAVLLYEARKLLEATDRAPSESANDEAIERLRTITRVYSHTPAAGQAYWQLGHLHFSRGDDAAALAAYEQAQQWFSDKDQLSSVLVILDVAYAQEAKGACDKALGNYETVQQSSAVWLHGEAYLGLGRCYEQRGVVDQAIAVYERGLADGAVTGPARQTMSDRLARLQPRVETPAEQQQAPQTDASTAAHGTSATPPDTSGVATPAASPSPDAPGVEPKHTPPSPGTSTNP
jgi:predicted negative regulator of RcsB-dependent stress response